MSLNGDLHQPYQGQIEGGKMNEQELRELNKKLAEWVGFREQELADLHGRPEGNLGWYYPNGAWARFIPDFTQSLDACFKWLVPRLSHYRLDKTSPNEHHAYVDRKKSAWAESPTLALCLAIEKLSHADVLLELANG